MPATYTDRLEGLTTSVAVKAPCRVTATNPIILSGIQSIDGVTVEAGDRVLAQAQANPIDNGIWMVGTGMWRRALDFDGTRDAVGGTFLKVVEGDLNANTYWDVAGFGRIDIGTDEIHINPTSGNITLQASLAAPTGTSLIGYLQAGFGAVRRTVMSRLRESIYVKDFGAVCDGETDDSAAAQKAIDYLQSVGGGTLIVTGNMLAGGLAISARDMNIRGRSRNDRLTVLNGTTGITWSQNWGSIRSLGIYSQGTVDDGLGTNGVLLSRGASNQSSGHFKIEDLDIKGFSGTGFEAVNTLDFVSDWVFFGQCKKGLRFSRGGVGAADFSTTVFVRTTYFSACDIGLDGDHLYRSKLNVIGEYCGEAVRVNAGDVTLDRCYFENNTTHGAHFIDAFSHEINCYKNGPTDDVFVEWTLGVIAAADRGYTRMQGFDFLAKRMGVLSNFGVDPKYLAGVGDSSNIGLKYGAAIVPRVYGKDLLNQAAWASSTTSEFAGWDVTNSAYKIASASTGVRGLKQSVALDSTKTYVIDFTARNVSGLPLSTLRVDGVGVMTGVPFTVAATGAVVVEALNTQVAASENYVEVFRLMEVLEDRSQVAKATDAIVRRPAQRGDIYMSAAPTTGTWAVGEFVRNSAPTAGGVFGWVCTTAGSAGTWKPVAVGA